jgi:AcrR family transcriptional regulator
MSNKEATGRRWTRLGPEARREQILATAQGLFEERGYEGVSMSDVATAAKVTRGLVHHYFGSKRELYVEVVRSLLGDVPVLIGPDEASSLEDMVKRNANAVLDYYSANRQLLLEIAPSPDRGRDPEIAALAESAREAAVDRVVSNHFGDSPAPPEVRLVIRSFLGLVEEASREWLLRRRATRAQLEALLTEAMLALMRDALPAVMEAGKRTSRKA